MRVERETDAGRVVFELPLPAVVGVKEGINLPRYPTMKGRLASKKVAVTTIEPAAAPGGQRLVSLQTPPEQASHDGRARAGRRRRARPSSTCWSRSACSP